MKERKEDPNLRSQHKSDHAKQRRKSTEASKFATSLPTAARLRKYQLKRKTDKWKRKKGRQEYLGLTDYYSHKQTAPEYLPYLRTDKAHIELATQREIKCATHQYFGQNSTRI